MPLPPCLILVLLSALSLSAARSDAQEKLTSKDGAHFQLVLHFENESIAAEALRTVEAVWPIVTKALGIKDEPPAKLLEVHLYRDAAAYEVAEDKLTKGKFKRNQAFSHHATKSAHVALQPPCSDEALRALNLPAQTRRLLAHEACHIVRYHGLPNFVDHPEWFADGLASFADDQVMIAGGWSTGMESDPNTSTSILHAQRLERSGKLPPPRDLFADRVDDLDFSDRYAARKLFFTFLKSERNAAKLEKIITAIRQTKSSPKYKQQVLDAVDKAIATSDQKALHKDFQKHVSALKPQWEEIYRSLVTTTEDWPQLAFADVNAIAWRTERIKAPAFTATGSLRILPAPSQQLNFLFGRSERGFFSISFGAGYGVTLFRYETNGDVWTKLDKAEFAGLRVGITSTFRIDIAGNNLAVLVDDKRLLSVQLPEKITDLQWGLGVQANSAGIWGSVKVGPSK